MRRPALRGASRRRRLPPSPAAAPPATTPAATPPLLAAMLLPLLLLADAARAARDVPVYRVTAVKGDAVYLPCDISTTDPDDSVLLVLWYRMDLGTPIYSVDARERSFDLAERWSSERVFANRAYFLAEKQPAELGVDHVTESDAGVYRCRVDFRVAQTRNSRVNLTVIVPPERIVILDESGTERTSVVGPYMQGANLALRCDVYGGSPRPWVRWYRDDMPAGGPARQLPGVGAPVSADLVLKNLGRSDLHSQLRCAASNNNRTAALEAIVTVDMNFGPLNVRILGASQPLSAGRRYDLLCQSSGSRPPASITWWRNGQRLERTKETTSNDGNTTTSTLSFNASKDDAGKYLNCRAENPVLSSDGLEDGWKLEIQYVPEARLQLGTSLNPDAIREGTDVYFDCLIKAQPAVYKVEWRHNGRQLNHNVGQGVIVSNQSLVLQGVSRASAGNYTCVGFNAEGDGESAPFYLNVMYAPTCKPNQSRVHGVAKQEKARIACEVEANPPAVDFRWTFNNSAETVEVQESHISKNGTVSLVSYTPQTEMDYGTLLCWASNRIGHQRVPCVYHIIAAGRPDPVHNCTVANASMTSFSVRCSEGFNGGLPQNFLLEVREAHTQTLHTNVTAAAPHFSVQGLAPGALYQACAYSFNLKGRSEPVPVQAATLRLPEKQHTLDKDRSRGGLRFTPMLSALIGVVAALLVVAVAVVVVLRVQCSRNADRRKRHKAAAAAAAASQESRGGSANGGGGGGGGGGRGGGGGGTGALGGPGGGGVTAAGVTTHAGCGPYGPDAGPAAVAAAAAADKVGSPLRKMDAGLGPDTGTDTDEKNPDIIPQASAASADDRADYGRKRQHISTIEAASAAAARGGLLQQGLAAPTAYAPGYCTLRNGLPLHDLNNLASKPKMKALNESAGYPTLPRQHWPAYGGRHAHGLAHSGTHGGSHPHAPGAALGPHAAGGLGGASGGAGGGALLCASYPGHLQHPPPTHLAHHLPPPHLAPHVAQLGPAPLSARHAAAIVVGDLSPPLPPLVTRAPATAGLPVPPPQVPPSAVPSAVATPPPAANAAVGPDEEHATAETPLMVTKRESTV